MNNITNFIEVICAAYKDIDSYALFELCRNNEKLLKQLCEL